HALLGENGAGKTTLMNILYGLYHADEGEILIDGEPVRFGSPGDAIAAGLGMVHQHFMLVPVFTVTENVMLGIETTRRLGLLDRRQARRQVEEISRRFGFDIPPDAIVEELPVGVQQRVEIVKALYRQARVLILDEPTAVLTPQETEELFTVMRALKSEFRGSVAVDGVSLDVRAGEIVCIAGVQGNGQTELVEAITALRPAVSGSIRLLEHETKAASPRSVIRQGVGHVPEDRQRDGLIVDFS